MQGARKEGRMHTLEWDGVLRLLAASNEISVMGSEAHPLIGIGLGVVPDAKRDVAPIPIELVITPVAAAGLLANLLDMQREGRIPRDAVASIKTTRQ
jgi:hypothetical protein